MTMPHEASLIAQLIKNPPAMQETPVRFLSWEDPPEEGMATHSSILAWKIPMDRGAWWATVHGVSKSQTRLSRILLSYVYGASRVVPVVKKMPPNVEDLRDICSILRWGRYPWEGNSSPLQYSYLENFMDREAIVHRVIKSQTWLKWLTMHAHMYICMCMW